MSAGPWQPRSVTCASSTAGVASVSSAVVTFPVLKPACCAFSRIVVSGAKVTGSTDTALL
jgi:hypothetical protein